MDLRKFLLRGTLFVLPLVALLVAVEVQLARMPDPYRVRRVNLERRLGDIEVLVTGASHANYGIRPSLLGPAAFSIAHDAQDLYYDAALLARYLDAMPRLKLVIVTVSYHSFEFSLCRSVEAWRCGLYTRIWGLPRPGPRRDLTNDGLAALLRDHSYVALYGPRRVVRLAARGFRVDLSRRFDETGWRRSPLTSPPPSSTAARRRLARHHALVSSEHLSANVAALDTMLAALRARGVAAVIVTTPVLSSYAEGIDVERYRRMQDTLAALSARHGAEYRNYLSDGRFVATDFLDGDHLNGGGATRLTQILASEVVSRHLTSFRAAGTGQGGVDRVAWRRARPPSHRLLYDFGRIRLDRCDLEWGRRRAQRVHVPAPRPQVT